jgi:signal transduction histidine kinase
VCSVGNDGEVLGWNHAIEQLTQIPAVTIVGSNVEQLEEPWRSLFTGFVYGEETHNYRCKIKFHGMSRWLSLHKAAIRAEQESQRQNGLVLVVEDQTEMRMLEHQLTHNERLASVGRLAAGVAHEIGNPITGIACLAQNMISETEDPEINEMSRQILDQTRRVSRIVQSLVSFSHSGNTQVIREAVNLHLCAQGAIDLIKLSRRGRDYNIDNVISVEHIVSGDEQRLTQVLVNLLGNAIDASEPGTTISLTSTAYPHTIILMVEDQGSGIPKDILERIFEPFVTTKDPGQGTGLGMSLVYSIIEEHDGQISIESPSPATLAGTRVTVTLPRYQDSVTPVTAISNTRQE